MHDKNSIGYEFPGIQILQLVKKIDIVARVFVFVSSRKKV
jgi:hypothetical protein